MVTVTNTRSSAMTVKSYAFIGTNASTFELTGKTCSTSLGAGASCTLSIAFKPETSGTLTANLAMTDNVLDYPQAVSLTGTGATLETFSPGSLTFAPTSVGSTAAAKTITVTNTGTIAVTAKSYAITGANASDFLLTGKTCTTSLATGASCIISIAFKPAAAGVLSANLVLTDSASGSPQTIPLMGTGYTPEPISFSPGSLAFASTKVGSTSAAQTMTVTNTSTAAIAIKSYTFTGIDAAAFLLTGKTCSTSLAAGASCTLSIAFKSTASGNLTANLAATESISGMSQTVGLSGTGATP
jgi:hypothetical protein